MKICSCVRFPFMSNGGINPDCPIHNPRTGGTMSYYPYPTRGGSTSHYTPELPDDRRQEAEEQYREELANEPASKLDLHQTEEKASEEVRKLRAELDYSFEKQRLLGMEYGWEARQAGVPKTDIIQEPQRTPKASAASKLAVAVSLISFMLALIALVTQGGVL